MDKHHCVCLTEQGRAVAEVLLNRHGTLLSLLLDLGVPEAVATGDARAIAHNISPETCLALQQLLQERQVC